MRQAMADDTHLLLEATSNQVNQEGGYTGMTPADFVQFIQGLAQETGFRLDQLILGGDHLGPNAWQHLDAASAMNMATEMVRDYAAAGFLKIHLDASMRCADDPETLSDEVMAERAATLCAAAESASRAPDAEGISYVIGTEVPTPGGADHSLSTLQVTSSEAVERTLTIHHAAFEKSELESAWKRVIAIVVQPGVEFDHDGVIDYDSSKARHLQSFLVSHPELVMEAHSSDYQRLQAYGDLVRDGFAILKVGPALTFALREAFFALETIERWTVQPEERSNLQGTLDRVMLERPEHWRKYYRGTAQEQARLRAYSYSDRLRYYWGHAEVEASVVKLIKNLNRTGIPETLLSQHLPQEYDAFRDGKLTLGPEEIALAKVRSVLRAYSKATGGKK